MNQLEPVVTIGIPTFKRPDLLDQTLNHIFLQTYKNIKVIISNNGENYGISKKYRSFRNYTF